MRSIFTLSIILFNLNFAQAQDCVFFFLREPLPEPIKNYEVFEYSPVTKQEELILTVTFDSINKILKKTYHKDFYVWGDGYEDPGVGLTWFDDNNCPKKRITLRKGISDDGSYNYWEYYLYQYNELGKTLILEKPNIKNIPKSMQFNDTLLFGYFEKNYVFETVPRCKCYYNYDSLGRVDLIKNYTIEGDSIVNLFVYDKNCKIIRNEILKNGLLIEETSYSYENGFRISNYFSYDYKDGIQSKYNERAVFKVKFENEKLIYQSYSLEGKVLNETIYKYNKLGDLIECHQYLENKVLKRIMKYKYQK